ncbi:GyrI-like domain-containing protein [Emticicia sp. BO119]|uniref:GyrI-like domain-containing protein n=1 Tax=Emticicia sp. BO119 TaxID=2757768 RepID=UPI0015F0F61A|nr:GyrI-like domain-containing protein [Emticicia sp. BO119]MBA4849269.1 hypothetical protein [Emticicia sp. BO119]
MNIEIRKDLQLTIYGFGATALQKDYVDTVFKLSGKVWEVVKNLGLKSKGTNIWVYEPNNFVFAGVELDNTSNRLVEKKIKIEKYAYYKHIGSYKLIGSTGQKMINALVNMEYEAILPNIEIYGHWNSDESKLETELIMCLK